MIKVFMPLSGNVGDTLNAMPVLSGLYKSTGHQIYLTVRDKMKQFSGFRDFLCKQDCIFDVSFESDVLFDSSFCVLGLVDSFTKHSIRPWETVRLEEYFKQKYNIIFDVDDAFEFKVDEPNQPVPSKILIGDRMFSSNMDHRRSFNVLQSSKKFNVDECQFLDYNQSMSTIASIIKYNSKPFVTTFTGVSVIADLLKKQMVVLWGDDIRDWDNKPIEYSYNKHFYRDRNSRLEYLGDFKLDNVR